MTKQIAFAYMQPTINPTVESPIWTPPMKTWMEHVGGRKDNAV